MLFNLAQIVNYNIVTYRKKKQVNIDNAGKTIGKSGMTTQ